MDTAIELWINDGDPVSIHTLAASSHQIVHDILKYTGKGTTVLGDISLVQSGKEKEFRKLVKASVNFFKHADKDPEGIHEFDPIESPFLIFDAICGLKQLNHKSSPLMTTFWFHHMLSLPEIFNASMFPPQIKVSLPIKELRGMGKKEFFELFQS